MRSISQELLLENELQGMVQPVTDCHLETGDWRWADLSVEAGNAGIEGAQQRGHADTGERSHSSVLPDHLEPARHRGLGEAGDRCRTNDNSATGRQHSATKDDNWRQNLGTQPGLIGGVFQGRRPPALPFDPSKDAQGEKVMAICDREKARATDSCGWLAPGSPAWKVPETTTQGDKTRQNEKNAYTVDIFDGDSPVAAGNHQKGFQGAGAFVIPANSGTHRISQCLIIEGVRSERTPADGHRVPACAGMTEGGRYDPSAAVACVESFSADSRLGNVHRWKTGREASR